jgi:hypothetical protein
MTIRGLRRTRLDKFVELSVIHHDSAGGRLGALSAGRRLEAHFEGFGKLGLISRTIRFTAA